MVEAGGGAAPGPENQDSQYMLNQPRGSFNEKKVPKGVLGPLGPGRPKSQKRVKSGVKKPDLENAPFRMFSDLVGRREAAGTPFETFFGTSGRQERMTPENGQ